MKKTNFLMLVVATLFLFSCEDSEVLENPEFREISMKDPIYIDLGNTTRSITAKSNAKGTLSEINKVALYSAEYITTGENEEMGNIVFFNVRGNKKLPGDFLPFFSIDGNNEAISYYIDETRASEDLDVSVSSASIDSAMDTWDEITCSDLGLFKMSSDNSKLTGWVAAFVSDLPGASQDYGGTYDSAPADVMHNGWMPQEFFDDLFGPDNGVLAVTFDIVFTDDNGNFIDLDNNGKYDVAWREIYYNDQYSFFDDNGSYFDVETVALHEAGHGLSQDHFGKAFASGNFEKGNTKVHFSPRAVMNPAYSGTQTMIKETDKAGHCSNWASWPER